MGILSEARRKLEKVEEAFQKTEEAEKAVADSEAAAALVQQAIADARTYLSSKSLEVRRFIESISKPGLSQIAELTSKNDEAVKRLSEFKKETEVRKGSALLQQGQEKVDAVEEAVKKTAEAAAPLTAENADEVDGDAAQELCE